MSIEQAQEDTKGTEPNEYKRNLFALLLKNKWVFPLLWSALLAFFPFFGYSYLVSYLEAYGFTAVDISPKIYDLVQFGLGALLEPISVIAKIPVLKTLMYLALLTVLVAFVFSTLIASISYTHNKFKKNEKGIVKVDLKFDFDEVINSAGVSLVSYIKLFFYFCFHAGRLYFGVFFVFLSLVVILFVFVLIVFSGYQLGWKDGREAMEKLVCIDRNLNNAEIDQGYAFRCSEMQINGEIISGKRLFADKNSTYFVTNDGAYQVSPAGEILYFRPITRLGDKGNAKND